MKFQSTRPVRGATVFPTAPQLFHGYFNPRAPCGARPHPPFNTRRNLMISIHAPRAGRDFHQPTCSSFSAYFNPRAPCGARRVTEGTISKTLAISIHAPRAGRDRGGQKHSKGIAISIHAPRAGRDQAPVPGTAFPKDFNPRAPCGARLGLGGNSYHRTDFNPRAPCGARLWG